MNRSRIASLALGCIAAGIFAVSGGAGHAQQKPDAKFDAWLAAAKLGKHQAEENWDEIVAKAKQEGEVVVYSSTSTVKTLSEDFMKAYPGIKVKFFDLGSEKTIEKVVREQAANLYEADVVNTGGTEQMIYDMLPSGRIINYVPSYLVDRIPKHHREPLLVHVLEAYVIMYNADTYKDGPPITNIWELTDPKWKRRFAVKSPLGSLTTLAALAGFVEHSAEMEKAYEAWAGKKLVLSKGVPNAGYEFLKRIIANDLVIQDNGGKLAASSGTKGQANPPITLPSMHYIGRNQRDGMANAIPYDLNPTALLAYPSYVAIARNAPHPNAAKLYVAFMMGSKELNAKSEINAPYRSGKSLELLQGIAAFYQVGTFSPRTDVPMPPLSERWPTARKFEASPEFQRDNIAKINDFWIAESGK